MPSGLGGSWAGRLLRVARFVAYSPWFVLNWRVALIAAGREDWRVVDSRLQQINDRGYGSDDSHFWRGSALANLKRWDEAAAELGRVQEAPSTHEWHCIYLHNVAACLARLDRRNEALQFLLSRRATWPTPCVSEIEALVTQLDPSGPNDRREPSR